MGQVWLMRVEARTVRRLNSFRSSQSPALQMSSSDFRVPGDHFLHVLCKKKKERERERKNLLSANIVGPVMEACHLDRFYTFQKIWNYDPMTWITSKMEVNFPSLGGMLWSTTDLPRRVAESVFPIEKGEHVIRLRWPQRGIWGWPSAILSLENLLSVWFHRTLQPLFLAAARRRTLCRVNGVWPPELHLLPQPFPSSGTLPLVLPGGLCLLTTGLHALLFCYKVVFVPSKAAICKRLTMTSLSIVEVPGPWGLAVTC